MTVIDKKLPFDENTLVFCVYGKIFCIVDMEEFDFISVKCDPELSVELRATYLGVNPGYHMSKKHWNSISLNGIIPDKLLKEWIKHSYDMVLKKIPKSKRLAP
ncbi:MAG: hypothetical protein RIR85_1019 [Pseudomonadota bacterium]